VWVKHQQMPKSLLASVAFQVEIDRLRTEEAGEQGAGSKGEDLGLISPAIKGFRTYKFIYGSSPLPPAPCPFSSSMTQKKGNEGDKVKFSPPAPPAHPS
jgi:hypothetical protein